MIDDQLPIGGVVEPSAHMRELAHHVGQLYIALTTEGFTQNQALWLCAAVVTADRERK